MKADITYVVGDIHGCVDALRKALLWMAGDVSGDAQQGLKVRLVFLGDYVDRGPGSRAVIDELMRLMRHNDDIPSAHGDQFEVVCIQGNHEVMMLQSLHPETQEAMMPHWLKHGGTATLDNYIVDGAIDPSAMTPHLAFLRSLPVYFEDDHRIYVHAGLVTDGVAYVHPSDGLHTEVYRQAMQWMSVGPPKMDYTMVPKLVVVGHVALKEPVLRNNGLMLDTGAGKGGNLTVARFDDRVETPLLSFHPFPTVTT